MPKYTGEVDPLMGIPLVKTKHEHVRPKSQAPVADDYVPLNPWFCPVKDPDTKEKCGAMMGIWDDMAYKQFGMCEACAKKYNPHLFSGELDDFVDTKGNLLYEPKKV
jgi:hypothetical protein